MERLRAQPLGPETPEAGSLVPVPKWPFFTISALGFTFPCATYRSTSPWKRLPALTSQKTAHFRIGNPPAFIPDFGMKAR